MGQQLLLCLFGIVDVSNSWLLYKCIQFDPHNIICHPTYKNVFQYAFAWVRPIAKLFVIRNAGYIYHDYHPKR